MVRPSVPDPPELSDRLWQGFHGDLAWDVGANCGQTIIQLSWAFQRVMAFEPSPDSYAYAAQHTARFLGEDFPVDLYQIAFSDVDGHIELAYPAREQRETGQLVTIGLKGMEWEPKNWDKVEKVTVECWTADTFAGQHGGYPDFMKVDTEGHELAVLHGARGLLASGRTDLLIEFHSPENHRACHRLLADAGYRPETVRHPHYPPESHMWHQHGWMRAFAPRAA